MVHLSDGEPVRFTSFGHSIVSVAALAMLATACGGEEAVDVPSDEPSAETEPVDEPEPDTDLDDDAAPTEAEAADDSPQAYTSLLVQGDPDLTARGAVAITLGPAGRNDVPFLIDNGTDDTISHVEVSGMAVDGDGNTFGSGRSQGVEPNVIPPDGVGFGYVYVGPDDLPPDATTTTPPSTTPSASATSRTSSPSTSKS